MPDEAILRALYRLWRRLGGMPKQKEENLKLAIKGLHEFPYVLEIRYKVR
jgi:hypothetical protein